MDPIFRVCNDSRLPISLGSEVIRLVPRFRIFRLGKEEKKSLLMLLILFFTRFICVTLEGKLNSGMAVSWLFCKRRFLRVGMLKTGRTEKALSELAVRLVRLVRLLTRSGSVVLE